MVTPFNVKCSHKFQIFSNFPFSLNVLTKLREIDRALVEQYGFVTKQEKLCYLEVGQTVKKTPCVNTQPHLRSLTVPLYHIYLYSHLRALVNY